MTPAQSSGEGPALGDPLISAPAEGVGAATGYAQRHWRFIDTPDVSGVVGVEPFSGFEDARLNEPVPYSGFEDARLNEPVPYSGFEDARLNEPVPFSGFEEDGLRPGDSLRLGANDRYWADFVLAARFTKGKVSPEILASLLPAEAARLDASGRRLTEEALVAFFERRKSQGEASVPLDDGYESPRLMESVQDLKSRLAEYRAIRRELAPVWDRRSYEPSTHAAGLGQVLEKTWLGMAMNPKYELNRMAVERGWVDSKGHVLNSEALLDFRNESYPNLVAVAQLAADAFDGLERRPELFGGQKFSTLPAGDQARYLYLMHHEGEPSGYSFIANKYSDEKSVNLLLAQFGYGDGNDLSKARSALEQAVPLVEKYGSPREAYYQWLWSYTRQRVVLGQPVNGRR